MEKHSRELLNLRQELSLALLPTVVVLLMLGYVEAFSRQRLLFASLASSAFLIYLDPEHPANRIHTVALAQACAALLGFGADWLLGAGYLAAGVVMVLTIFVTISARHASSCGVHFAGVRFPRQPGEPFFIVWSVPLLIILLVMLQQASLSLLRRWKSPASSL